MSLEPDSVRRVYEGSLLGVTVERWGDTSARSSSIRARLRSLRSMKRGTWRSSGSCVRRRGSSLLELPAGTAEEGEEPLETARRELQEECGLTGGEWRELAAFWTTPGFCRERMHMFAAEGVERGEASPAADEDLELVRWPVAEIGERLHEIEDAKTLAGLLLYLRTLPRGTSSG